MTVRRQILLGCALAALLLGAGCSGGDAPPLSAEVDEPLYREGQRLVKQGRTQEALAAFLKVIEKRGEQSSAESHLEAGNIFLDHSKDPFEAYHHFHQYLAQQPNSPQASLVKQRMDTAKREIARTLPGQLMENQASRFEAADEIKHLKEENAKLSAELATLQNSASAPSVRTTTRGPANFDPNSVHAVVPPPMAVPVISVDDSTPITAAPTQPTPAVVPPPTQPPPRTSTNPNARTGPVRPGTTNPAGGRRHTVEVKESLWGIATKYYGAASNERVQAILDANKDVLPNAAALKPGMELKIP